MVKPKSHRVGGIWLSCEKYMINPRINIGNRALAFVGFVIVFILVKIIGDRFGYTGVSVFLSILFGSIALFIVYCLIKIIIIAVKSYKETKNEEDKEDNGARPSDVS